MVKPKVNNETPSQKFRRLAEKRTQAILDKLRILGNLANRNRYEFNEEQINKIFSAIEKEVKLVKAKFLAELERKFEL